MAILAARFRRVIRQSGLRKLSRKDYGELRMQGRDLVPPDLPYQRKAQGEVTVRYAMTEGYNAPPRDVWVPVLQVRRKARYLLSHRNKFEEHRVPEDSVLRKQSLRLRVG